MLRSFNSQSLFRSVAKREWSNGATIDGASFHTQGGDSTYGAEYGERVIDFKHGISQERRLQGRPWFIFICRIFSGKKVA